MLRGSSNSKAHKENTNPGILKRSKDKIEAKRFQHNYSDLRSRLL